MATLQGWTKSVEAIPVRLNDYGILGSYIPVHYQLLYHLKVGARLHA